MIKFLNQLFVIVAIILSCVALSNNKQKNSNEFAIPYKVVLIIILFIGIVIRLWQFGIIPYGFNQDGAMAAIDGLSLAKYGTDHFGTLLPAHLYAWGYGQMSSLLSYLIAFFVKFAGLNVVTARLPQLLASIMGGIFFYLFMKDTFGKEIGFIAAFFVAINPWHFIQSRWALDCNLLPHFFITGLYFLNRGLSNKKINIYISMIFFALCMYCYGITIYTIPVFLLAAAIYYYINKQLTIKDILISIGIYLLISWPFILTMAVNFFKWDTIELPFVTIQYFPDSIRSNDIIFFSNNILRQLLLNIKSLVEMTILQKNDLPWNEIDGFGTMYYFTIPFTILGIIELLKNRINGNKSLVVFAILTGIWVGITTNNVNINRLNIIYYSIMILSVIGIHQTIKKVKYAKWIIFAIYGIFSTLLLYTYFTDYANNIGRYFYAGFGEALTKAENANTSKIYVTADVQLPGYAHVSEALTLFYSKIDAKYFQGKTNINNGKEYLPYNERYHYKSITPYLINNAEEDIAYVIMKEDKQFFGDGYVIIDYGDYSTVIKKQE